VGAAPFTIKCFKNNCVCREVIEDGDSTHNDNDDHLKLEKGLKEKCKQLDHMGYMGDAFQIKLKWQAETVLW
jgi:hypothetical protein